MGNPVAVAMQGLGFGAAQMALQGLLAAMQELEQQAATSGGALGKVRRKTRVRTQPTWSLVEFEDELLLIGVL